ncbi:claudin 23a [Clupea harengus]|uniref:Claudin 23a n=1 Tax=Clupea harengus TaxID=7950 RepID=A0A6P3WDW0_CLUHA|nr:claudin 23a [Clupea harengus]
MPSGTFIHYRTPGILIFGMVLAPCGWVLDLTATVAPNWRTINDIDGEPIGTFLQQGIWDICRATTTSRDIQCNQQDEAYFNEQIIEIAQAMMVASLILTLIGLAVAIPGVRCWRERPNWTVAGLGGLLIFLSGVLTLIPIAWYTHILTDIAAASTDIRVGYSIILGYIGGIMEVLGGFVMFIGICRCCGGRNRSENVVADTGKSTRNPSPPRRITIPSINRTRSTASSVPYSKDSFDEIEFPRANVNGNRSKASSSYGGQPYDADL